MPHENIAARLNDHLHAFCDDTEAYLAGAGHGPLAGLTFAAKEIFAADISPA